MKVVICLDEPETCESARNVLRLHGLIQQWLGAFSEFRDAPVLISPSTDYDHTYHAEDYIP